MPPTLEGFSDEMRFYRSFSSWNIQFGNIFFPNLLLKIHFHGIHLCVTERESIGAEGIAELPTVAARVLAEGLASQERLLERYVVDWSLKTRVRFTSKTPFPCSSTLKVHVEGPDARSLSLSFFEEELLLTRFFFADVRRGFGHHGLRAARAVARRRRPVGEFAGHESQRAVPRLLPLLAAPVAALALHVPARHAGARRHLVADLPRRRRRQDREMPPRRLVPPPPLPFSLFFCLLFTGSYTYVIIYRKKKTIPATVWL